MWDSLLEGGRVLFSELCLPLFLGLQTPAFWCHQQRRAVLSRLHPIFLGPQVLPKPVCQNISAVQRCEWCLLTGTASARSLPWLSCGSSWLWPCSGFVWGWETIWNSQGQFADFLSWSCVQREACGCRWNLWTPKQESRLEDQKNMWKQVSLVYLSLLYSNRLQVGLNIQIYWNVNHRLA